MKNNFAPGKEIEFVVSGTVPSGSLVQAGSLVGVTAADYTNGQVGVMEIEGAFILTKAAGVAWTLGMPLYKTAATQVVTTVSASNVFLGYAYEAADSAAVVGKVLLARPGS